MSGKPTRFVLLGDRHSGVVQLAHLLRRHAAVAMRGEPLAGPGPSGEEVAAHLDRTVFGIGDAPAAKAIGLEPHYDHARTDGGSTWDELIARKDIAIIHVTRTDLLACVVEKRATEKADGCMPFYVPPEVCRAEFDRLVTAQWWARRAFDNHRVLEVDYQSYVRDAFGKTHAAICRFIGVDPEGFGSRNRMPKLRSSTPSDQQLANFAQLREVFHYGPYQTQFAPVGPVRAILQALCGW